EKHSVRGGGVAGVVIMLDAVWLDEDSFTVGPQDPLEGRLAAGLDVGPVVDTGIAGDEVVTEEVAIQFIGSAVGHDQIEAWEIVILVGGVIAPNLPSKHAQARKAIVAHRF